MQNHAIKSHRVYRENEDKGTISKNFINDPLKKGRNLIKMVAQFYTF